MDTTCPIHGYWPQMTDRCPECESSESGSLHCCATVPRCMVCKMDLDPTEYGHPDDADICGYCFAAKTSEIQNRDIPWPEGLGKIGKFREISSMADTEIRLEDARKRNDAQQIKTYEKFLRLLMA